ncbi:hypothetical protein Tco_0575370 [Tanacetum coccineum]
MLDIMIQKRVSMLVRRSQLHMEAILHNKGCSRDLIWLMISKNAQRSHNPLNKPIDHRIIVQTGISLKARVCDLIDNGSWIWLVKWEGRFKEVLDVPVPTIVHAITDIFRVWFGLFMGFRVCCGKSVRLTKDLSDEDGFYIDAAIVNPDYTNSRDAMEYGKLNVKMPSAGRGVMKTNMVPAGVESDHLIVC